MASNVDDVTHHTRSAQPRIYTRFGNRRKLYLPDKPVLAGGTRGSYVFERHIVAPGNMPPHVFEDHMLLLPMSNEAVLFRSRLNGRQVNGRFEPGRFRFLAAGDSLSTSWTVPMESILLAIHPGVVQRALGDDLGSLSCDFISNLLPHIDPILTYLTLTLQSYVMAGCIAGVLFEQSLLVTIAAHLVHTYGKFGRRTRGEPLASWKRLRVEEYVRSNLTGDLSLDEIAAVAQLSPCQLSRTFKATTGQGLWRFVLGCRVREAMRLMNLHRTMPLSYIARNCGFDSYSQFIAAFRKVTGVLPREYRRMHGS